MESIFPIVYNHTEDRDVASRGDAESDTARCVKGLSLSIVMGPDEQSLLPLLVQSAVTHGSCGCSVLVFTPSRLQRLPPPIRGMPVPDTRTMATVTFLYASDATQLQRHLAALHTLPASDRPTHFIVTNLQHYVTSARASDAVSEAVHISKLLALLSEAVHFTSANRKPPKTTNINESNVVTEKTSSCAGTSTDGIECVASSVNVHEEESDLDLNKNRNAALRSSTKGSDISNAACVQLEKPFSNNDCAQNNVIRDRETNVCASITLQVMNERESCSGFCAKGCTSDFINTDDVDTPDEVGDFSSRNDDVRMHPFLRDHNFESAGDSDVDVESYQNTVDFSKNQYSLLDSSYRDLPTGTKGKTVPASVVKNYTGIKNNNQLIGSESAGPRSQFCKPSSCLGIVLVGWPSGIDRSPAAPPRSLSRPSDVEYVARHLGYQVWSILQKRNSLHGSSFNRSPCGPKKTCGRNKENPQYMTNKSKNYEEEYDAVTLDSKGSVLRCIHYCITEDSVYLLNVNKE